MSINAGIQIDENMFEIFGIFFSIFQDEKPRRMRDELISLIGRWLVSLLFWD